MGRGAGEQLTALQEVTPFAGFLLHAAVAPASFSSHVQLLKGLSAPTVRQAEGWDRRRGAHGLEVAGVKGGPRLRGAGSGALRWEYALKREQHSGQ